MWVAGKLSGADGPSGMDAMAFQSWLLRFVQASAIIKEEITAWPDWISNESPPCKAYHAIMSVRLVSLEKSQGVRTVEIREVCRRLFAKLFLQSGGAQSEKAYGSVNLCAGLESGIEEAIHTVREREELSRGETVIEQRERLELVEKTCLREYL